MTPRAPLPALAVAALLALTPLPGTAQDLPPKDEDGLSLIERGIGLLMENVLREIGPDLGRIGDDMSGILSRLGPALDDLSVLVDDIGNYQAPERLENGDIIIRRKAGAPPPPPIGDNLRDLARPGPSQDDPAPPAPLDPSQPEISL